MSKRDKVGDDQNKILPGIKSQSSPMVRRSGQPVILIHSHRQPASAAASAGSGDAISSTDGPQSVGEIAVRLLAEWSLPRMSLPPARGEGEGREQHLITRREERTDQD